MHYTPALGLTALREAIARFYHDRFGADVAPERIIVTPVNDIYYAEAHEKMTFVYTRRESYVMAMNITEFCSKLPAAHFFRCHRSFCVNLNKIREIEPWFNNTYILRLKDLDFQVPVSRSKVKEFRQLMHL